MIYVSCLGKEISLQQYLRYSINLGEYGITSYQAEFLKNARTGNLLLSYRDKTYFSLPEMLGTEWQGSPLRHTCLMTGGEALTLPRTFRRRGLQFHWETLESPIHLISTTHFYFCCWCVCIKVLQR